MQCVEGIKHLLKNTTALTPAEQLNLEYPRPATKRSRLSQLSHEELQNMLWENTFFMTSTSNNAKMQWPYSGENMPETVWYYPVCLYCSCGGSGAWSLQDTVHLYPSSPAGFLHIGLPTHTHMYRVVMGREVKVLSLFPTFQLSIISCFD